MTEKKSVVAQAAAKKKASSGKQADANSPARLSRRVILWRRFRRNKTALVGAVGLGIIVMIALFAPYLSKWDYTVPDQTAFLKPPSAQHWFGTDPGGFDMFAMTIEGLRKSLLIGFAVAAIQTTIAAFVGASAAYFGGWFDRVTLWVVDLLLVIPSFLIIAVLAHSTGKASGSVWMLILLLGAFGWMLSSRVVRSLTLSVRTLDYVTAAKYMSVPAFSIITKHILPNISSLLIIDATLGVASAVLAETTLSYFGFGVQAPEVSLGTLISYGQARATTHPWLFMPPAAVLTLALVCVNFVGDGVRDALDPSSKSAGGNA
ncbi:ABC transporter permease [Buchananella felis]|uniref:ABC transporter permease n=1 Tax=Buchananella felis TaxID=3231492 RepID=UPI003526E4BB